MSAVVDRFLAELRADPEFAGQAQLIRDCIIGAMAGLDRRFGSEPQSSPLLPAADITTQMLTAA
jgi:hypothetical protein